MYQVSDAFKTAIKAPCVEFAIQGTIAGKTFTKGNILQGSFVITNQCSSDNEVEIGSVYTGELTATFLNMDLDRYGVNKKTVIPSYGVKLANNTYENIPLGVYNIQEAEWSAVGVSIRAYDNISKLDRECSEQVSGSAFDIATYACNKCGVELANEDFNSFVNGDKYFIEYPENDIETYRDLIHWLAQSLGCFVTANRQGKIEFRKYTQNIADTIDEYHRFEGGKFNDYITRYTGLTVVDMDTDEETVSYYNVIPDTGLTYSLGSNPFLQTSLMSEECRTNVLTAIRQINYVPFEITAVANPAYDLGDILCLPNGLGDETKLFCITKYTLTYNGDLKLKGAGKNPLLSSVKSKTDKSIAGLKRSKDDEKIRYYLFTNVEDILIGDGETKKILEVRFQSMKPTIAVFHAEVLLEAETTVSGITYNDAVGRIKYYFRENLIYDYEPEETWFDGKHILHLLYYFNILDTQMNHFEVMLNMSGGSALIKSADIKACVYGQALYATDNFDGIIKIVENMSDVSASLNGIDVLNPMTEAVSTGSKQTSIATFTENMFGIIATIRGITVTNGMIETVITEVEET